MHQVWRNVTIYKSKDINLLFLYSSQSESVAKITSKVLNKSQLHLIHFVSFSQNLCQFCLSLQK